MTIDRSFQRTAAVAAILSMPLAFGNTIAMLLAVDFNVDALVDPLGLLAAGADAALWRASMILDMLGYYLLIIPLILVLRRWLAQRAPAWADLAALALLSYSLVGAAGAAIHAAVLPPLMDTYAATDAGRQGAIRELFLAMHNAVMYGLWNLLDALTSGVSWLGFGVLLVRERRALGVATLILGAASLADAMGTALGVEALASVGLFVYLFLAPAWACWLGVELLRRPADAAQPAGASASATLPARSGA